MTSQPRPRSTLVARVVDEKDGRRPIFKRKMEDDPTTLSVRNVRGRTMDQTEDEIEEKRRLEVEFPRIETASTQSGLMDQSCQGSPDHSKTRTDSSMATATKLRPHGSHSHLNSEGDSNLGFSDT